MEVQETNIKARMKSFRRVTTKHKSYYLHAEGISQNGCNARGGGGNFYPSTPFRIGLN